MKRAAAFLLGLLMLVGSFVPGNDLSELAKLPDLVRHYRYHHSAAGGGLSLAEFLADHYGAGEKQHEGCTFADWHRRAHHNLPLHCGHHAGGWVAVAPIPVGRLLADPAPRTASPAYRALAAPRYPLGWRAGLLQPPRA